MWLRLFVGVSLAAVVLSYSFEVFQARSLVQQYIGIWEDDIAKAKVFQGDPSLQNKILKQLTEVHPAVAKAEVDSLGLQCALGTAVPITYNSLPAGALKVCFNPGALLAQALVSPLFLVSILFGLVFLGFGWRRELMAQLHEQKLQGELLLNKEIASMARQVAHDIRGPLTALTTLSQLSHEMSEDKKELLNLAVTRIRGVADDLLSRGHRFRSNTPLANFEMVEGPDLAQLMESLLKEYRFSNSHVNFTWHKHVTSAKVTAGIEAIKFQRILSNLINNALEAAPETQAAINLTLMERAEHWLVQLMDNGSGIPEDVLPTLGTEGRSYGKESGCGLGLYDARKTLETLGGELHIRSRLGVGTQVVLVIPKQKPELLRSY